MINSSVVTPVAVREISSGMSLSSAHRAIQNSPPLANLPIFGIL